MKPASYRHVEFLGLRSIRWLPFLLVVGCAPKPAPPLEVRAGTPVNLALLQSLESGRESEGTPVRAMLMDSIRAADGTPVAEAGAVVMGTVTRSRGASAFTAIANQPARLEVRFDSVRIPNGSTIEITGGPEGIYELTRGNTGAPARTSQLAENLPPDQKAALEKLRATFDQPNGVQNLSEDDVKALKDLASSLGLGSLGKVAEKEASKGVDELVKGLVAGSGVASGGAAPLVMAAAGELLDLAGQATRVFGGMLKGANIKAPVGTRLEFRVAKDTTVPADAKRS